MPRYAGTKHLISAIIPAAGASRRMGVFKPALPFGSHTIIQHIVQVLAQSQVHDIIVVSGSRRQVLEQLLSDAPCRLVHNPNWAQGEMLSSIQAGLDALAPEGEAVLICPADQPQIQAATVRSLIARFLARGPHRLYVPSYRLRRGHPLLIPRSFWPEILALSWTQTLRALFQAHPDTIDYLVVTTPSVLGDIDTPADYGAALQER